MSDFANEPAFPVEDSYHTGLTRLEWFAGQALQGALASTANSPAFDVNKDTSAKIAFVCFTIAEAMCSEAERRRK